MRSDALRRIRSSEADFEIGNEQEVTAAQWERLVEVRGKKIIQEEEVKKLTVVMNEMQGCLNELTSADDTNRRKIESALRELAGMDTQQQLSAVVW